VRIRCSFVVTFQDRTPGRKKKLLRQYVLVRAPRPQLRCGRSVVREERAPHVPLIRPISDGRWPPSNIEEMEKAAPFGTAFARDVHV